MRRFLLCNGTIPVIAGLHHAFFTGKTKVREEQTEALSVYNSGISKTNQAPTG
ncbi:hypothetical protein JCM10003_2129 [Bacteroides pyogenes JCM 10003]|nr:hypothetical protein JCM10003_2129 [Bacteroides pyogenes JCM 10003]